jgi:hypothetical protein
MKIDPYDIGTKCLRCGQIDEPPSEVWWRYFWISVVATPAIAIGMPLGTRFLGDLSSWLPLQSWLSAFPTDAGLLGLLIIPTGATISAHLLARAQGLGSHSGNAIAYWMLFVVLYAMLTAFGVHTVQHWMR